MEVHHKPQPFHGWREFLKEYGIIVLGVLTALAGEQIVEAIHHHDQVRDLSRALDRELAWDLARMKEYVDVSGCVGQRLDELDRWKASLEAGRPLKLKGRIEAPLGLIFRTSVWRSAAGATVDLLPLEKRIAYAEFYDGVQNNDHLRARANDIWDDLSVFESAAALTPDQRLRVAHDLEGLRDADRTMRHNYETWTTSLAPPLGVTIANAPHLTTTKALVDQGRAEFCQPLLAP